MPHRIDLTLGHEGALEVRRGRAEHEEGVVRRLLAGLIPIRHLNLPGPPGCSTLIASCNTCALFEILRRVREDADRRHDVASADILSACGCRRRSRPQAYAHPR